MTITGKMASSTRGPQQQGGAKANYKSIWWVVRLRPPPVVVGLWLGSPSSLLWSWVPVSPLKQIKTKNQKNPQKMEKQKTKNKTKTKKYVFFGAQIGAHGVGGRRDRFWPLTRGGTHNPLFFPAFWWLVLFCCLRGVVSCWLCSGLVW